MVVYIAEMVVHMVEMVVYMVEMVMGEGFVFGGKSNVSRIDSRCKRTPPAPRSSLTIRLLYRECRESLVRIRSDGGTTGGDRPARLLFAPIVYTLLI